MNTRLFAPAFFAFLLASTNALAAPGKVIISSPTNGAMFSTNDKVVLTYEAVPGPDGDHLHLYLDGKRIDIIHQLKGMAEVGMLDPGSHHICLAINTKSHVPTGAEGCVDVTVK